MTAHEQAIFIGRYGEKDKQSHDYWDKAFHAAGSTLSKNAGACALHAICAAAGSDLAEGRKQTNRFTRLHWRDKSSLPAKAKGKQHYSEYEKYGYFYDRDPAHLDPKWSAASTAHWEKFETWLESNWADYVIVKLGTTRTAVASHLRNLPFEFGLRAANGLSRASSVGEPSNTVIDEYNDLRKFESWAKANVANVTEAEAIVRLRVTQGSFRRDQLKKWQGRCAITGLALLYMLVASHIYPWRVATDVQRQDPFNGLLLSAALDRAFDRFLISFQDDGRILVSPTACQELEKIGIRGDERIAELHRDHLPYLRMHRKLYYESC